MKINKKNHRAFTLIEAVMAVAILAAITTSVLVVMNRCITAAIDIRTKTRAFELARENMEKLLASETLSDMAEFGFSEQYPDIEWQTTVESFYEPVTSRMWTQAVCSAKYFDSDNQQQTVELTHWLTDLTKQQVLKILDQQLREAEYMDQVEYEEYISERQNATVQYLDQNNFETIDYENLIDDQKQQRLDWLDENEYNKEEYHELTQNQRDEEDVFLAEDLGVDLDELEEHIDEVIPAFLNPANKASSPDTTGTNTQSPTGSDSTNSGRVTFTEAQLLEMGVPEAWIPLFMEQYKK
jgi:type II secretory pathway pseudopilin PulG